MTLHHTNLSLRLICLVSFCYFFVFLCLICLKDNAIFHIRLSFLMLFIMYHYHKSRDWTKSYVQIKIKQWKLSKNFHYVNLLFVVVKICMLVKYFGIVKSINYNYLYKVWYLVWNAYDKIAWIIKITREFRWLWYS